jgi:hypothetical protein
MLNGTAALSWLQRSLRHQGSGLIISSSRADISREKTASNKLNELTSLDDYLACMASSLSDEELCFHNSRLPSRECWSRFHVSIAREVQVRERRLDLDLTPYLIGPPNDRRHEPS